MWLLPRHELTAEQLRAIDQPPDGHRLIVGAPGSGKTQILLHRAAALRDRLRAPPERFRIFVYTNALKAYLRSALDLLRLPPDAVTTYDDWCRVYVEQRMQRPLPWDRRNRRPDFAAIRGLVAEHITRLTAAPWYDFAMVDEGQDLEPLCFAVLARAARHLTICIDSRQQLYERGSDERRIREALGGRLGGLTLLDAYRCSPYIARLAAQLLEDPTDRDRYLRQVRTGQTEREAPLLYEASSFDDEAERLVAVLRQRLLCDRRIAILFPLRRQVQGFAQRLAAAGFEVEPQDALEFASSRPKLMTIHSAKGLTFETVLLPRLVPSSFPPALAGRVRQLLFVAITRATRWVYLSTQQDDPLPALTPLRALAGSGQLTIQRSQPAATRVRAVEPTVPAPASDLDFL